MSYQLESAATDKVAGINNASACEAIIFFPNSTTTDKTKWIFTDGNIASAMDHNLVLDVSGGSAKQDALVVLYPKSGNLNQRWRFEDGYIVSELDSSFVLAVNNADALVIQKKSNASQKWLWSDPNAPRPASSCYLNYNPKLVQKLASCSYWKITLAVKATEVTNDTYFCTIGWPPGGYSGIQQHLFNGKPTRYVIFSFWNHKTDGVTEVASGEGVVVEEFGGEGTGLKCKKPVPWILDDPVKFEISGQLQDDKSWVVSCYITVEGSRQFIASLQRSGPRPLTSIYSFIEDWNRGYRVTGYRSCRAANYSAPILQVDDESETIKEASLRKITDGHDAVAVQKVKAEVKDDWFYMLSGGPGAYDCENQLLRHKFQLSYSATSQVAGVQKASACVAVTMFDSSVIQDKTSWIFAGGNIITALDNNLVLDVSGGYARQNASVVLYPKTGNPNQSWKFEDGYLVSELNSSFVLSVRYNRLVLQRKTGPGQKWSW